MTICRFTGRKLVDFFSANSFTPSLMPSEFGPSLRTIPHAGFNICANMLTKTKKHVDICALQAPSGKTYCH